MKLFLLLLILAAFIQTSFLSINLVLLLVICRSFVIEERANLIGSFVAGIVLGILSAQNIGFWPLIFLILVKVVGFLRKLPLSSNYLTILPTSFVLILIIVFLESLFFHQALDFKKAIIETLLCLPIYLLFRLWEERFIVKSDIKLRIRG